MKKIFTFLAAVLACSIAFAETVVLSPSTAKTYETNLTTFTGANEGYTITNANTKKSGKVSVNGVDYIKYSSGVQYTITLPIDIEVLSVNFQGRTRKTDGTGGYIAEVNGVTYGKTDYTCGDLNSESDCNHTFTFETPVISALTFTIRNTESIYNITLEVRTKGAEDTRVEAPISWNPAEKTISIEDAKTFSPVLEGAEGLVGIVYSSDNELVATVDEAGKVAFTGKSGKVTITATYPGDETYKPTTVKSVVSVELGKEIKVGEVVLPVGAIGEEVANGTSVKYIVAANTEIFADANITVTNKTATLRAADSKNICGADLSNYIQIRNQNDENTELVITPKANMELVVYGRLQDRATDMPEVQNTKNITLTEDGASALAGTLYFSEWLAGTEAKPYEYFLMGQSFNLEAGKTYTLSASGFGFRLYGFSYTAEALPSIEAPGHDQYGDIVEADGEQVVTFTPAVEGHVIYTCFVPAVVDNAMALAADATIEHDGKTFSLAADNKVTVSTSGTLHYFAMEPASGIKSEVKSIEFAISTAITDINVDNANAPVEYFNLQGIRVENPANGLYIRRQGNKVEKVYVK